MTSAEPKRRRNNPPELREAESQMKEAFSMLKAVVAKKDDEKEDECELYGKMLASKLRKLPELERDFLMHNINGMVINALHRSGVSMSSYSSQTSQAAACCPLSTYTSTNVSSDAESTQHSTVDQPAGQFDPIREAFLMTFEKENL